MSCKVYNIKDLVVKYLNETQANLCDAMIFDKMICNLPNFSNREKSTMLETKLKDFTPDQHHRKQRLTWCFVKEVFIQGKVTK